MRAMYSPAERKEHLRYKTVYMGIREHLDISLRRDSLIISPTIILLVTKM